MKFLAAISVSLLLGSLGFVSLFQKAATVDVSATVSDNNTAADVIRFKLDPSKSTFICHANRAGIAYFKGRSHRVAVKDFDGEASMSLDSVSPASLTMTIRSASLEETDPIFTPQEKGTINGELNKIVLETAKYPEITFKSTDITGSLKNGAFDVKVTGDITLHGITRRVTIPATVTVNGDTFEAKGNFSLNRKRFGVNATEAFHGFVKVRHVLKFEFDIIGQRV
ncbi:MAG TPA: YceI family protein [Pyrinomonadaceae bacterium]|nr:YceI family protein [Pyrinomonadaceae bacterium]